MGWVRSSHLGWLAKLRTAGGAVGGVPPGAPGALALGCRSSPPQLPARPSSAGRGKVMDRNPSPPPPGCDQEEEEVAGGDCIGSTVYSKHWLFGVLSGLIQVWKLAPRVGSPHIPQAPGLRLWRLLLPREPPSPRRPLPRRALWDLARCVSPAAADPRTIWGPSGSLDTKGSIMLGMLEYLRFYFSFSSSPKIHDRVTALLGFCSPSPLSFLKPRSLVYIFHGL